MKTKIIKNISTPDFAILALIIFGATIIKAAPGDLDLTFGNGGIVVTRGSDPIDLNYASASAIQSDGKIVVVGSNSLDFAVVRYNGDGSLDNSFGGTGIVITPFSISFLDRATSLAIQADGKIVVAGTTYNGFSDAFAVARYNTDGSLDTSFNGTGKVITSFSFSYGGACSVAMQADGKIVAFGNSGAPDDYFTVVRYNTNGSLDTTFNGTGIVTTSVASNAIHLPSSVAIQADGKIVAGGGVSFDGSPKFAIVRYNTDGSLDTSFNGTGKAITPVGNLQSIARDLAIQTDGKIVAAGWCNNADFALVRYNPNGSLDTSFGGTGKIIIPIGNWSSSGSSVAIQSDGKIVAVGQVSYKGLGSGFALVRLERNGSLDTNFNETGKVITLVGSGRDDGASSVAIQADGKFVVAGSADAGAGNVDFAVVRYQGDPPPSAHASGKIAFTSDRDGNLEIYLMNSDGTDQTRVTNNTIVDDHPMWSPNGKKLAFVSQRETGGFAIFQMNVDGTNRLEITPLSSFVNVPPNGLFGFSMSWSPDGRKIAFQDPYYDDIWVVDVETHARQNLTNDGCGEMFALCDYHPAWSPDGSTIVYASPRYGGYCPRLYAINPDGTNRRLLSGDHCPAYSPSWSPDGMKIVFARLNGGASVNGGPSVSQLRIANSDGTNVANFDGGSFPVNYRDSPRWSSDGRTIAFNISNFQNNIQDIQIYIKNVDGTGYAQLTDSAAGQNYRPSWQPLAKAGFDFDGDGQTDISTFRPSDRVWYLNRSTAGFSATQFGLGSDKLTPADFDGDGKTDIAVYRDGTWYWLGSLNDSFHAFQFGTTGDMPVPADFTGDGRSELAIYRSGVWWMLDLSNNQVNAIQFGLSTDKPVVADYDGDGRADQAVYRNGEWHLNRSSQGYTAVSFGLATDKPVVGDYDGDGRADQAVYRDGIWYLLRSTQGFTALQFGIASDIPAPADYDGDGKTDLAVYRDGIWYLLQSTSGFSAQQFGLANDMPVPSAFLQ